MWVLGGVLLYGSRAAGRTRTWVRSKGTLRCTSDGTYGLSYHQFPAIFLLLGSNVSDPQVKVWTSHPPQRPATMLTPL